MNTRVTRYTTEDGKMMKWSLKESYTHNCNYRHRKMQKGKKENVKS